LGTLSAHVKELEEASPLKIREYLAYGLPVVTGVRDTDFPGGSAFFLELPNTEHNVIENEARIEKLARAWMHQRVPRDAVQHLDTAKKERAKIAFIRRVLEP
jgi:hypothetical protein